MRQSPLQRIFDLPQHLGASSSRYSVASTVPTSLKSGSSGTRKQVADCDSVVSSEESVSREDSDRDVNVVQTLKDRQNLHKFLEWKAEFAGRGEKSAQKKLSEVEAEMEIRSSEKRNSSIALYESHQELEPQRKQLQKANQWADRAEREKINLCGKWEMRNRVFRENRAKNAKKLKNCEEIVAKKQIELHKN